MNTIGNVINQARKDKGLTVAELASKAGVIEATLKNLIGNRITYPRRENLEPLCEELGLDIEEVMKNVPKEEENISVKQHEHHIYDILESHAKLEAHYEKRLADKREVIAELEKHIQTIQLDKKWFRIGFIVVLSLFIIFLIGFVTLELMHPEHGWIKW